MGRTYKPKVKMYTDLTIETAIDEVSRGAKVQPTAKKYHMSVSTLRRRVMESKGLITRGTQVIFLQHQINLFMIIDILCPPIN